MKIELFPQRSIFLYYYQPYSFSVYNQVLTICCLVWTNTTLKINQKYLKKGKRKTPKINIHKSDMTRNLGTKNSILILISLLL